LWRSILLAEGEQDATVEGTFFCAPLEGHFFKHSFLSASQMLWDFLHVLKAAIQSLTHSAFEGTVEATSTINAKKLRIAISTFELRLRWMYNVAKTAPFLA
jgi:hypothetical protein